MRRVKGITYKDSGVDIEAAKSSVRLIKKSVKSTFREEVLTEIGGFSGLFSLNLDKYKEPVLVSGTDGVGTKLKIAFLMDRHDTVGIDLVAMCVDDIITSGAEPLFFLDYLSLGKLNPKKVLEIVKGITKGCQLAGCALIGGETAEMPGMYKKDEYDLAGFSVGVVEREKIIDGKKISSGDKIIGLSSSGLHSNGYSLARRLLLKRYKIDDYIQSLGKTLGEELLMPTRIYAKLLLRLIDKFEVKGIAHITGGGLLENIPRILPQKAKAVIRKNSWPSLPIFSLIQKLGRVEDKEMFRTFNMGIGMVIIVPGREANLVLKELKDEKEEGYLIGEVKKGERGVEIKNFEF